MHNAMMAAADHAATRIQLERMSRLSFRSSKPAASAACWRPCNAAVDMITTMSSANSQADAQIGTWPGRRISSQMPPTVAASTPGTTTSTKRRLCAAS